jgi:hypothetical protein
VAAVEKHAEQFDTKLPSRPAGSQQEAVATSYLLGHLQEAGYLVRLDGVPVKDLVRSTNVIASPPSGKNPTIAVLVSYDTAPDGPSDGEVLGLWLELARALNVKDPGHSVEFVALGANHLDAPGAPLGERRLATLYKELGIKPDIIQIPMAADTAPSGNGPLIDEILSFVGPAARPTGTPPSGPDPLEEAGFGHTFVWGAADKLGPALLRYLSQ